MEDLLTIEEVTALLGKSRQTVYNMIEDGRLPPPARLGRLRRWQRSTIEAVIEREAELMSSTEVAQWLGVFPNTVKIWGQEGRLPEPVQWGKVIRWERSVLEQAIAAAGRKAVKQITRPSKRAGSGPPAAARMTTGSGPHGQRTGMGTFRITVEIADPRGQRFEAVEMLVDTGATFTKAPRDLLERLGVPVEGTYTAELADGSRVERTRGRTVIRLEGKEFPTPVTFGEDGEQNLLGAMALEDAMLAVDPHSKRLIPVDALEMTSTEI